MGSLIKIPVLAKYMKTQKSTQLTPLQKVAVSRKLLEAEIIARAWEDDAFRAKLESNPAAALMEAGLPLPENKTIQVIVEAPDVLTLILPPSPTGTSEVNDNELAEVAGGGLIQNGKCEHYGKHDDLQRTGNFFTYTGYMLYTAISATAGFSWGWGS